MASIIDIHTQVELDALVARTKGTISSTVVRLDAHAFTIAAPIRLNGSQIIPLIGSPSIKYTGAKNAYASAISLQGTASVVRGIAIDAGGCDTFGISGSGHRVESVRGSNCNDFCNINTGADNITITRCNVPMVDGYAVYTSGRKTLSADKSKMVTDYVTNLTVTYNTFGGSRYMHVFRFHDLIGLQLHHNTAVRANTDGVMRDVLKGMDGANWDIHDNIFSAKNGSTYTSMQGCIEFGPLGGGDGGLKLSPGPERDRMLALQLKGVKFYRNRLDDVRVDLNVGAKELDLHDNTFIHQRDSTYEYHPVINGCDYRKFRGEPTGKIYANKTTTVSTNKRGVIGGAPAGIQHWGNAINGVLVD